MDFSHPIISVSLHVESPLLSRVFKPKTLQLGMYTRKIKVILTVRSDAVIESYNSKEIVFNIENLEFSLLNSNKNGKCIFVIRDQLLALSRIYQVASFVELCWWFESLKKLKENYKRSILRTESMAFIPKPKRLSLVTLEQNTQHFETSTKESQRNLDTLRDELRQLKNSIQ